MLSTAEASSNLYLLKTVVLKMVLSGGAKHISCRLLNSPKTSKIGTQPLWTKTKLAVLAAFLQSKDHLLAKTCREWVLTMSTLAQAKTARAATVQWSQRRPQTSTGAHTAVRTKTISSTQMTSLSISATVTCAFWILRTLKAKMRACSRSFHPSRKEAVLCFKSHPVSIWCRFQRSNQLEYTTWSRARCLNFLPWKNLGQ